MPKTTPITWSQFRDKLFNEWDELRAQDLAGLLSPDIDELANRISSATGQDELEVRHRLNQLMDQYGFNPKRE